VKGLGQVVVGAGLEATEPVSLADPPGEHEDRQLGIEAVARGADLTQHVDPRGIGQPQVEQHQVRVVVAAEAQRIGGARRGQRPIAVGRQVIAEQLACRVVVLADHHGRQLFDLRQHAWLSRIRIDFSPQKGAPPRSAVSP
jgi:hypothetical protein